MNRKFLTKEQLLELYPYAPTELIDSVVDGMVEFSQVRIVYPSGYEMHADGVKEVTECPFCPPEDPCNEPHCPYTKDE